MSNTHAIVENYIATVNVDDKLWDCFGLKHKDGPEVIQCCPKGLGADYYDDLSDSRINDIKAACERLWLSGNLDDSEFYKSLNKEEK